MSLAEPNQRADDLPLLRPQAVERWMGRRFGTPLRTHWSAHPYIAKFSALFGLFKTSRSACAKRTPVVMQMESADCGLACLAMISGYHGGTHVLRDVKEAVGWDGQGSNLESLSEDAQRLGFRAAGLRCEPEDLRHVELPCVLHWGMRHFVVLTQVQRTGLVIHDPAYGRHFVGWPEAADFFTGVAFQLTPEERIQAGRNEEQPSFMKVLNVGKWRRDFATLLLLAAAVEVLGIAIPLQQKISIDAATHANTEILETLALAFAILVLSQRLLSLVKNWLMCILTARMGLDLRSRFTSMLHSKPAEFFAARTASDIFNRSRSADTIEVTMGSGLVAAAFDGTSGLLMLAALCFIAPQLSVICISALVLVISLAVGIQGFAIDRTRRQLVAKSILDSTMLENIRTSISVRLAGREADRKAVWQAAAQDASNASLSAGKLTVATQEIKAAVIGLEWVLSIAMAAKMMANSELPAGTLFLFFAIKFQFFARVNSSVEYFLLLRNLRPHAERMADVLLEDAADARLRAQDQSRTTSLKTSCAPEIRLVDLGYRLSKSSPFLFRHVNLTFGAGESVAITGHSGCGKSTLLKIIAGLIEPTEGQVLMDGIDISTIRRGALSRIMSFVMQEDQLFAGSLAENVALFQKPIDMPRVIDCATLVAMHELIESMPMGYHTLCGDTYGGLSGGQKQRLFIARALYQKPRLLIMDEATSHLDPGAEGHVNRAICGMDITRILVAHRSETVVSADRQVHFDTNQLKWLEASTAKQTF